MNYNAWLNAPKNATPLELRVKLRIVAHINESRTKEAQSLSKAVLIERVRRHNQHWLDMHT